MATRCITAKQVTLIKTLQGKAHLDDTHYRELLYRLFKKKSCKDLTFREASRLIDELNKVNRSVAPQKLTDKQIQTIKSLWEQVSYLPADQQEAGLRRFLLRQCGVEALNWVSRADAPSVICALKVMLIFTKKKEKSNEQ